MNKNKEKRFPIGLVICIIAGIILAAFCFGLYISSELGRKYITLEGEIIDTEFRTEWIGGMNKRNILTITMDDNSTYDILIHDEYYDFTVNSHMIIELTKAGGNSVWEIEHIVKVPGKP